MVWKLTRAVRREVVGKAGKAARWLPTLPGENFFSQRITTSFFWWES